MLHPNTSDRSHRICLYVMAVLLIVGVASRFWLLEYPNFKPVAAIALFAGFLLGRRWLAFAAPLLMLVVSDALLGWYEFGVMAAVYGSIFISVGLGMTLRNWCRPNRSLATTAVGILGASALMSATFYLLTNVAVVYAGWYPATWQGLGTSLAAGLPFFRFTLLGDMLFASGLFASYGFAQSLAGRRITLGRVRRVVADPARH